MGKTPVKTTEQALAEAEALAEIEAEERAKDNSPVKEAEIEAEKRKTENAGKGGTPTTPKSAEAVQAPPQPRAEAPQPPPQGLVDAIEGNNPNFDPLKIVNIGDADPRLDDRFTTEDYVPSEEDRARLWAKGEAARGMEGGHQYGHGDQYYGEPTSPPVERPNIRPGSPISKRTEDEMRRGNDIVRGRYNR
jgi:hypothetical protein